MSSSSNQTDMVLSLSDYLTIERVNASVTVASKKKLLEHIASLLGDEEKTLTKKIFHSIIEREKLGSTGVGNGVAIPHGRCEEIEEARLCVVTLEQAIDYEAKDNKNVDIAFGLIVPSEANQQHLSLLSLIAELMSKQSVHDQLVSSKTASEIFQKII